MLKNALTAASLVAFSFALPVAISGQPAGADSLSQGHPCQQSPYGQYPQYDQYGRLCDHAQPYGDQHWHHGHPYGHHHWHHGHHHPYGHHGYGGYR
ncbi:hypothetical protein [Sphaerisporangium perillae]|uniref:hypothetical protein n=1 Tax=Sphaerisporangium perillae TaxID=2935860 RepID=UPI00200CBF19|nr:hypothetical protein [Sphaerisporangium perillae]